MNHKEFLDRLSAVNGTPVEELSKQIESIPVALADLLKADEDLAIPGFGTFEVHKRLERVVENAATGRRTLTPPRLLMRFNPNLPSQPKYTLHDMAVQVAKKQKLEVEKALQLTAQCFGTIHEGLQADGFVSVIGLGTFRKEAQTEDALPVVLFIADESLAGLVNRPFAELPEVELAPTTDLRELEAVNAEYAPEKVSPEPEQEPATSDATPLESDAGQASNDSLEQTAATSASDASTEDDAEEPHEGELSASEGSEDADTPAQPLYESSETVESEDSTVTASEDAATEQTEEGNVLWKRAAIVFATAFIALLCFILLRYERSEILPPKETPAPQITTQKADTIPVSKERTQHITLKDRSEVFTHFEPDGVLDEHTIVFGDVLIRLAEHYYGNPYFVKYIIEYNNLPASGYTPVGTVLKIPRLRRKPGM